MIESQNKVRLGELLVESNVVSSSDLTEAIQVSTRLNIPIGRVLLLSGLVSPLTLEAALEAQPLINEDKETKNDVLKALQEVDSTGASLKKMLPGSDYKSASISSDKLAGLLLDSEIVSQGELDQALSTSFEEGVPLGSALVMEGILSPSLFPSIHKIQQDIREGRISKTEAIEQVKSTFMHWLKAEESLSSQVPKEENHLQNNSPKVPIQPLNSLIEPVESSTPELKGSKTIETQSPSISITFEPRESDHKTRAIDLLKEANLVDDKSINEAFNNALSDPDATSQILEILGLIDSQKKKKLLKCQSLLKQGQLSRQEAVYALTNQDDEVSQPVEVKSEKKIKRYFDEEHRKSMLSKVVGGMVVGAAVAGFSLLKGKSK